MSAFSKYIGLDISSDERLESRVAKIIRYIAGNFQNLSIHVLELDATGQKASSLSDEFFTEDLSLILEIFEEDGQIIDLDMMVENPEVRIQIIVVDGQHVDVNTSKGVDLNEEVTGKWFDISPGYTQRVI